MKHYFNYFLITLAFTLIVRPGHAANLPADSAKEIPLTLNEVWEKAEINSKAVQIRDLSIKSSDEGIKDAKAERLPDQAIKIANGLLNKSITVQSQLKFSVDYYHWISWLILGTILLIALFPSVGQVDISVKNNQPAAVAF